MKEIPQHLIHVCLEDGRSIDQAIRHHLVFIVPCGGDEGDLPLVPLSNPDQIVCTEKRSSLVYTVGPQRSSKSGRYQNKWVLELDGAVTEYSIIYTGVDTTLLFGYKDEA